MSENQEDAKQPFWARMFHRLFLVSHMFGVEATCSLEIIMMTANVQTLGVPTRLSTLPGTVSGVLSLVLIPALGFIMDNWAKSKKGKASILIFTSCVHLVGTSLIFFSNCVKLLYYDQLGVSPSACSGTNSTNETFIDELHVMNYTYFTPTSRNMFELPVKERHINHSDTTRSLNLTESSDIAAPQEDTSVQYYAVLAIIGYALMDSGLDATGCFLKTFVLATTPQEHHATVIVKSILVASLGGCLIAILVSAGLGGLLTQGTSHDSNAAQCAFLSALCLVLLLLGLLTTLSTGLCCKPSRGWNQSATKQCFTSSDGEKSQLIISSQVVQIHLSRKDDSDDQKDSRYCPKQRGLCTSEEPLTIEHMALKMQEGVVRFIERQKKQIILNIGFFFIFGSLYSFQVYSVNFLGQAILHGNPEADTNSEEYINYLLGIQIGSSGILCFYISFVIANSFQEIVLWKLGWKLEMIIVCSGYVTVNMLCALTSTLWSYYILCVFTGAFKAVVVSVPYILANQFALEQSGDQSTGVAIAVVASMIPSGLTLCSAVVGPLIDLTGNTAVSLYYTALGTSLGLMTLLFLK